MLTEWDLHFAQCTPGWSCVQDHHASRTVRSVLFGGRSEVSAEEEGCGMETKMLSE